MEASYFYYRPVDIIWEGNNKQGDFLDKGFNMKFAYNPKNTDLTLAIGLDDFAGTGLFSREYFVSSLRREKFNFSIGIGWGKYNGESKFKNPLKYLKKNMEYRNTYEIGNGGQLSYKEWFRGDAGIFGGVEIYIPKGNGLKLKIEYDPFNYFDFSGNYETELFDSRIKKSNINYGLTYPINKNLDLQLSYIKGNTLNFSFTLGTTFLKNTKSKTKFDPKITNLKQVSDKKDSFYLDLLRNLNNNNILLQTAELKSKSLSIAVSSSEHRNPVRLASYSGYIANKVIKNNDLDIYNISVSHINTGIEMNKIELRSKDLESLNSMIQIELVKNYSSIKPGNTSSYLENEFVPNILFPVVFSSVNPEIVSHIGAPEKFYLGGIALTHSSEIHFSRNLIFTSNVSLNVDNNFKDTVSGPASLLPHVRTDIMEYLKQGDLYLQNLQLDYIWSPKKNIYTRLTAGLFETMFGGIGAEILYKPFDSKFYIGLETFYVKQRDYDQKFSFRNYQTTTSHLNLGYYLPYGMEINFSYGRYLAKDDGFTLGLSRDCLLYTSPSPRDRTRSRMPSSA